MSDTTVLPMMEMKRTWKIENFSMCPIGAWLESPPFRFDQASDPDDPTGTRSWRIRMRVGDPDQKTAQQRDKITLQLGIEDGNPFQAAYNVYWGQDFVRAMRPVETIDPPSGFFYERHGDYSECRYPKWSTRQELMRNRNIEDDSITILLHVRKLARPTEARVEIKISPTAELKEMQAVDPLHQLALDFGHMLDQDHTVHSDIIIECGDGEKLHAHRCILASRCEMFRGMLNAPMVESQESVIRLPEYSSVVIKALLHYIYTSKYHLDKEGKEEKGESKTESDVDDAYLQLLSAAHQYRLQGLVDQCIEYYQYPARINTSNVAALLNAAEQYELPKLKGMVHDFFKAQPTRVQEFLGGETWQQLNAKAFRDLMAEVCDDKQTKKRKAETNLLESLSKKAHVA